MDMKTVVGVEMTLAEAIDVVNAVVKGELRVDGGIEVGDWWDIVDCRHQQCRGCEKCE